MGLFYEAATRIVAHLRARATGFHPIQDVLDRECARQQTALDAVYSKLVAGHVLQPEDAVCVKAPLESYQCVEGSMHWGEQWVCPSADLLTYMDQEGPYNSTAMAQPHPRHLPLKWEGHLQMVFTVSSCLVPIQIPLTSLPWTEPRGQIRWLKPGAKKVGKPVRKWEQESLQPFKEPHPHLGQRVWRFPMHEVTPVEEVLTHLVIVALKQGFPVSIDDQQAALQWVQHIVQDGVRRLGEGDSQQMSKDVVGEVFDGLVKRFDLPATPWALQDYIKETARGLIRDQRKKLPPQTFQEPWRDSLSGEWRYPDAWVAQDIDRSQRTVTRWKADHGINGEGFSETELAAIRQEYASKKKRRCLRELGKTYGVPPGTVNKLFQRIKRDDGTPDYEAIEAHIKRHSEEAGAMTSSEDTLSIGDQIAALKAQLAEEVHGSDIWCAIWDAIRRLEKQQQGSTL